MGGKHKKKSSGLSVIWIPGRRSHKYKTINNRQHSNYHSANRHSANITGTHNAAYSDMMSGDSTLPLSSNNSELKIDVNSCPPTTTTNITGTTATIGAIGTIGTIGTLSTNVTETQDKSIQSDETAAAAVLADSKNSNGILANNELTVDENEPLNKDSGNQTGNDDNNKTDRLLTTIGNSDKIDGVWKPNDVKMKVGDNESAEEEECVVKCLYYTIQCCECAIQ